MEPVTAPAASADTAVPVAPAAELRPPVDAAVCRLLGLPPTVPVKGTPGTRPGEVERAFSKSMLVSAAPAADLVALDEALRTLARHDPRKAQVVELRYFGGMTVDEIAQHLDVSPVTVKRDWSLARAWLYRAIGDQPLE